ncbi:MAG TPA: MFS transporter [Vicinamibacterales bacterium]
MTDDVHQTAARKPPPSPAWRWAVLLAVSVAMFGNYYAYDSVGPVADALQRLLHFTDTQIGTLNAIYSFPNIIMVLIGGIIVDRFGAARATFAFALIQAIGAIVTALSPSFPVMAAGRLIFGLGAESMIVAITVVIGQWFVGRQLGFAFGLNLSFARLGSYSADMSTTWFKPLYDRGWQPPLWLAAGFAAACAAGALVYYLIERRARQRFDLPEPTPSDRFVWRDLLRFDRSYWYLVGLCVTFYSVIFPFRSTFAIKYFQHAHGLSLQEAGAMNAYVFLAAIFATPAFGLLADRLARRAAFMAFGTFLLCAVFPILAFTDMSLWVPTAMIGVAFSLVPAVIWPAVPYVVEPTRLGTAYGLMTMLQNIGMMLANLGAGALNDAAGAGPTNPGGYRPMLWMFLFLSLFGFLFAAALRVRESGPRGHGLETIRASEKSA